MSGTIGLFPSTLTAGETYTATFSAPYPAAIADAKNASAVAMLINTQTGEVINAAKSPVVPNSTAIEALPDTSATSQDVYSTSGVMLRHAASQSEINSLPRGIYVIGNKKVVVR